MTEGSMTGQPYGGVNDPSNEEGVPGEVPLNQGEEQVPAAPDQSPRAAQGEMSDEVTRVPGSGTSTKPAGTPDATGPQG